MGAGGRPTKYKTEYVRQVGLLAKLGATEPQIAEFFEVAVDTLTEWKNRHPEFSAALNKSRQLSDFEVEKSLFQRAKGFKRVVQRLDKHGTPIDCLEEVPPDPTSCIFWLKNRQRERWRDKQELEHTGSLQVRAVIQDG